MLSQLFIFLLIAIAFIVAVGLSRKKSMWPLIVLYWLVLTAKNVADWIG